jgi:L-2-hydroxyglutarate oxidase LhgO
MSYKADITIIGAGVVGLAIASEVARDGREVYILEKNESFGREQSSRNSQTIHAGIYFEKGFLKTKFCVEANPLMYEICNREGIPFNKCGKLNIATNDAEEKMLQSLFMRAMDLGVEARRLSQKELKSLEPELVVRQAFLTPSTGVLDTYSLMQYFLEKGRKKGVQIAYGSLVTGIESANSGYNIRIENQDGEFTFHTRILINSAGLFSDHIAALSGIDIDKENYRVHYLKGDYFTVASPKNRAIKHLIYPIPSEVNFGAHICLDPDMRLRIGPFGYRVDSIDYKVFSIEPERLKETGIMKALPFLEPADLEQESAGIMANIQGPLDPLRDFIIRNEADKGLPGFINLVGMDSPALTSSPVIARYVAKMVDEIYN